MSFCGRAEGKDLNQVSGHLDELRILYDEAGQ